MIAFWFFYCNSGNNAVNFPICYKGERTGFCGNFYYNKHKRFDKIINSCIIANVKRQTKNQKIKGAYHEGTRQQWPGI